MEGVDLVVIDVGGISDSGDELGTGLTGTVLVEWGICDSLLLDITTRGIMSSGCGVLESS